MSLVPRGWPNTVEVVLSDVSSSTKPYPFACHAYIIYEITVS